MILPWHLYLMAIIYIIAGLNHFRNPRLYLKIIPPYLPNPKAVNTISGVAEIVLGIALMIDHSLVWQLGSYCTTDCRVSNSCLYVSKSKSTNGVTAMGFDFKDAITITTYVLGLQYTFLCN
jgi:uncharacterized membrane protein